MKRLLLLALMSIALGSSTGCCFIDRLFCCGPAHYGCGAHHGCHAGPAACDCGPAGPSGPPVMTYGMGAETGPPTGQVAYPYYTLRGPRDFYADNPGYPRN